MDDETVERGWCIVGMRLKRRSNMPAMNK